MMNQHQNKQIHCEEHISLACFAINLPPQAVKALFHSKKISIIDHFDDETKEIMIEVRFDIATLTCLFNENDICDGAYLFLDELSDIVHYIQHCTKTYPYHYILQGWIFNDCCIQISTENKECSLLVLPIKQV